MADAGKSERILRVRQAREQKRALQYHVRFVNYYERGLRSPFLSVFYPYFQE